MRTVNIYIDTSIKGPRRRAGAYMYILQVQTAAGSADAGDAEYLQDTTDNQATLKALEKALGRMRQPSHLVIWIENTYVAAALRNKWYLTWADSQWMTAKKEPVADAETWRRIQYLLNEHDFDVRLKEAHEYRAWMASELKKMESCTGATERKNNV